ncbi:hypothetical protein SAMN05216241_1243 [Limimonas halophila]|uniref:DUF1476 domain-containing protein n=1 Tax=Limimonas halophila TaxID=1082479 RepID=A0A1G7V8X1_9PROT|nr:DUF1476 domain-containing protein [Limimonas halophila]SDG56164.1 hypothetical protein SAMN05216241_1243 [Limimonas halophila]
MSFKDREEAYESQYVHDESLKFRIQARRDKLFGLWVAEQLGKKGNEAEQYARDVINSDLSEPGDEDVKAKVRQDLQAANVEVHDHLLDRRLDDFHQEARRQIMTE